MARFMWLWCHSARWDTPAAEIISTSMVSLKVLYHVQIGPSDNLSTKHSSAISGDLISVAYCIAVWCSQRINIILRFLYYKWPDKIHKLPIIISQVEVTCICRGWLWHSACYSYSMDMWNCIGPGLLCNVIPCAHVPGIKWLVISVSCCLLLKCQF